MSEDHPVSHSEIPLPADMGDGPFLSGPLDSEAPRANMASIVSVLNDPPYKNFLTRGYPVAHTGWVRVSDTVSANSYKRVVQPLRIHMTPEYEPDKLVILFYGNKYDINSHMDGNIIPTTGKLSTIVTAIGFANDIASNGSILPALDSMYKIVMAPIDSDHEVNYCEAENYLSGSYVAPSGADTPHEFPFNNGALKSIQIEGDVGRNILLSFDIVNDDPASGRIIELTAQAFLIKKEEEESEEPETSSPPEQAPRASAPIGQMSSSRPLGASPNVVPGNETNALDTIADDKLRSDK